MDRGAWWATVRRRGLQRERTGGLCKGHIQLRSSRSPADGQRSREGPREKSQHAQRGRGLRGVLCAGSAALFRGTAGRGGGGDRPRGLGRHEAGRSRSRRALGSSYRPCGLGSSWRLFSGAEPRAQLSSVPEMSCSRLTWGWVFPLLITPSMLWLTRSTESPARTL